MKLIFLKTCVPKDIATNSVDTFLSKHTSEQHNIMAEFTDLSARMQLLRAKTKKKLPAKTSIDMPQNVLKMESSENSGRKNVIRQKNTTKKNTLQRSESTDQYSRNNMTESSDQFIRKQPTENTSQYLRRKEKEKKQLITDLKQDIMKEIVTIYFVCVWYSQV